MRLAIAAARQGFCNLNISDIGFVRSSDNIADVLSKRMQQKSLQKLIQEIFLRLLPKRWILRK